LGAKWLRLNTVSWQQIQPVRNGQYNWQSQIAFEQELISANQLELIPIVVVDDSPRWATIYPTSCGAIRSDRFEDFAAFMEAVVKRYSQPPYNVRYWELGNEVDVDPALVATDSAFGCWGDHTDPFYGGRHYGDMLKTVTPAIKRADPNAKVLTGGLMIMSPNSQTSDPGKPEKFLPGILEAGAAPYFDIVAFHAHHLYYGEPYLDNDGSRSPWAAYGAGFEAKANYVRSILQSYGVNKPLFIDEASFICPDSLPALCDTPSSRFFDEQVNFVVRAYVAALGGGVQALVWYTMEGPGWFNASLLDGSQSPRPVYLAYKNLIAQVAGAPLPPVVVDYAKLVHAYRFNMGSHLVDVVWAFGTTPVTISWPEADHLAMYDRLGQPITPMHSAGNNVFTVDNRPVFIHLKPQAMCATCAAPLARPNWR
jgi:hypothetical protein